MSKVIVAVLLGFFSSFAMADVVSDNFKAMAEAANIAADFGEICVAEHNATKSKAQCVAFEKAWNDFRLKQQTWQESFNQNGTVAEASATAAEYAAFLADMRRINPVLIYIASHEDEFPLS